MLRRITSQTLAVVTQHAVDRHIAIVIKKTSVRSTIDNLDKVNLERLNLLVGLHMCGTRTQSKAKKDTCAYKMRLYHEAYNQEHADATISVAIINARIGPGIGYLKCAARL